VDEGDGVTEIHQYQIDQVEDGNPAGGGDDSHLEILCDLDDLKAVGR
jgi:hypothetical protein